MADVNLSKAVRSNLLSLQNTANMMAKTQERLATGLKVNSAMDNPTNFFTASSLKSRAGDLGLLMDSVSNAVQTLSAADKGITAITKLVESAQATARQALQTSTTVSQIGAASAGTVTAGAFTAVDVSAAGDPAEAGALTGGAFADIDFTTEASTVSGGIDLTGDLDALAGETITFDDGQGNVATYTFTDTGTGADQSAALEAALTDAGFTAAIDGVSGELTVSRTDGAAFEITTSDGAVDTATGFTDGQAVAAGAVAELSFDITLDGAATATTVTIGAAELAAIDGGNGPADLSAVTADELAEAINLSLGANIASVAGTGELVFTSANPGADSEVAVDNVAVTGNATAGGIDAMDGQSNSGAAATGDSISFSISIDGAAATTVTIDSAAVDAYNLANTTTLDAEALSAEDIATLINDQLGAAIATVDADSGSLVFTSTTTGADSDVTITNFASSTTAGSSGIANATDAGNDAGAATDVANPKRAELVDQYNELLSQINDLAKDASYNGVNLLNGDELQVIFNEDGSSKLDISGVTFDFAGLGLAELDADAFDANTDINGILTDLKGTIETLRTQASKFGSNLSVVETRQNFTKDMINVLETGAANLTLADTNEEAANLLALQTRQQLASTALSMASQADQAVLRLF